MSQVAYKPISCKNCGHPQHCGSPYYLQIYDPGVDGEPYMVKACEKCRCVDCTKELPDNTIPKSMLNGL